MNFKNIGASGVLAVLLAGMVGCQKSADGTAVPAQSTAAAVASQPVPAKSVASPAATKVNFDASSPDRALKTYWALKDAMWAAEVKKALVQTPETLEMRRVLTGDELMVFDRNQRLEAYDTFEREIIEVKTETATRATAVVTIRNVTPIPTDAEPSKHQMEEREKGERFRYVLELVGDKWQVSEIYAYRTYLSPPSWQKYTNTKSSVPYFVMP